MKLCLNRHKLSVDPGSHHFIPHSRVNRIGKINGTGTGWKRLYISGRREAVDILVEQVQVAFQQAHKLLVVGHVLLPLQNFPEPVQLFLFLFLFRLRCFSVRSFLVFPVRGDTEFRDPVHLKGPDLNFKRFSLRADQRRVKGLVHIRLGHGDIVLETPRYRRIHFVDNAQRRVAVLYRLHNDPDRKQIVDLIQRLILVHHLFVDAEKVFGSPTDLRLYPGIVDVFFHIRDDAVDKRLPLRLLLIDLMNQIVIGFRLQILQGEIVQLIFDFCDTKPLGNRRIDINGLSCLFLLLVRRHIFQGPHVVKPVRQLDKNDPDVLGHCQKHFPEVFRLFLYFIPGIVQLTQLGDAVHDFRNLRAEFRRQLLLCHDRIFQDIVQEAGSNALLIQLQLRKDDRHAERMDNVRLPGLSFLFPVSLSGSLVCFSDHIEIGRGMIFPHASQELLIELLRRDEVIHGTQTGIDFSNFLFQFFIFQFSFFLCVFHVKHPLPVCPSYLPS